MPRRRRPNRRTRTSTNVDHFASNQHPRHSSIIHPTSKATMMLSESGPGGYQSGPLPPSDALASPLSSLESFYDPLARQPPQQPSQHLGLLPLPPPPTNVIILMKDQNSYQSAAQLEAEEKVPLNETDIFTGYNYGGEDPSTSAPASFVLGCFRGLRVRLMHWLGWFSVAFGVALFVSMALLVVFVATRPAAGQSAPISSAIALRSFAAQPADFHAAASSAPPTLMTDGSLPLNLAASNKGSQQQYQQYQHQYQSGAHARPHGASQSHHQSGSPDYPDYASHSGREKALRGFRK